MISSRSERQGKTKGKRLLAGRYDVELHCDCGKPYGLCGLLFLCSRDKMNATIVNLEGDKMNLIGDKIKYLPATNDPLSADVYFVDGDKYCYIYDVGNNEYSLSQIDQMAKEKVVILSHHHKDHTGNIERINYRNLYVGKLTYETIGKGIIVDDELIINDGVKIEVIHCPSPHTEGSLIVNVDNEYTLIADLYFTRPPFDKKKAIKMIESLKNIDTKYFVISHQEEAKVITKEELIVELLDYFNQ